MNPTGTKESQAADYKGCAALICSGDRAFLDYYRAMFISLHFTPVTATTPEAAVAILRLMIVAFVLVDSEEGLEGCRQVIHRARRDQHHADVVVLGRKLDLDFRHQVIAMGAASCLDHPALPDDMVHTLVPGHAEARNPVHSSP
jgi:ActR/RegA family two-component response regulator